MQSCIDCRNYKTCLGHLWYSYSDIRWCPWQIIWILEYFETLLAGNWPANPDGSSYTDAGIKTGFRNEAYFTKPEEILAEIEYRLNRVSRDAREALIDEVQSGTTNVNLLSRPARAALFYIKGWRRKDTEFAQWRAGKRYREERDGNKIGQNLKT